MQQTTVTPDGSASVAPDVSDPDRVKSLVVIGDLHVGAGPLDDFDAAIELELVSLLDDLARREPTELVINGDFLEFVQAEPWEGKELRGVGTDGTALCFTSAQSATKLAAILRSHPHVFAGLGRFLAANKGHRIVITPGNHDVDLFWPQVRADYMPSSSARPAAPSANG